MIREYLKENKNVIIFFILFAVGFNLVVLGICWLIPERLRSGGWFVAPDYKVKVIEQPAGNTKP